MPDHSADDAGGRWLPLKQAAPLLGLERDTLRKQLGRGERQGRRDNRGRWLVLVPDDAGTGRGTVLDAGRHVPAAVAEASGTDAGAVADLSRQLAERDVELARLEERLVAAEEAKAGLRRELGELKFERDKLLAMLDDVLAERRRPWPGLRRWFRRVWEGE